MFGTAECSTFEEALRLIADEGASVSSEALYALSGVSRAEAQRFRNVWPAVSLERRRRVVDSLVESAEANFELDFNALLRVTLEDPDDRVRFLSVEGLWEDESVALVAPLVRIVRHDEAMEVRAGAAASLGRFVLLAELGELAERYATLIRGTLLEAIDDSDEHVDVRRRAVEAIAYWGEDCVRDIIAATYEEPDDTMRVGAVFSMGRSADVFWSSTVQEELLGANPAIRYEAARASGELELKDAVPSLIRLVSDPDREVQLAAVAALGQIGGKQAREVLERCCRSADEAMRLMAEDALAESELGQQPLNLLAYGATMNKDEELKAED